MSLFRRLERRLGRFAIPNLTTILIVGQAALYVASIVPPGIHLERITLDPARVMQGEVWRVVTFLFAPPGMGPLFVLFWFMLFHLFGTSLERHWGAFRFNVFLIVGWLANVAAAFAASAIIGSMHPDADSRLALAAIPATNGFLYSSLFLAFARLYPDYIINLFFVLPIRIRWLALVEWIIYAYLIVSGDWMTRLLVVATVLNYLLFFGGEHWRELRQHKRRRSFQAKAKTSTAAPFHVCRVCGLSSADAPRTAFRYCSKCEGQQCYCPDHIRNHEHVIAETPAAP